MGKQWKLQDIHRQLLIDGRGNLIGSNNPFNRVRTSIPDLARETLETLGLLIPKSGPEGRNVWFEGQRLLYPELDRRAGEQNCRSRNRYHYEYWGFRLLKLEEEFNDPKNASVSSWLEDPRNPRDTAIYRATYYGVMIALIGFILAVISTIVSLPLAGISLKESRIANSIASVASVSADNSASSSISSQLAMNGSTSSPVTIVACCSATTTGNGSMILSSTDFNLPTAPNATVFITVIETATVLATVTTTESVTDTIVLTQGAKL